MNPRRALLVAFLLGVLACFPLGGTAQTNAEPLTVFVTILPQKDFVARIGGRYVNVQVLVPPGKSHETYEPTPRQISDLAKAKIFFLIGLPLEKALLPKLKNIAQLAIVDTRQGIALRPLEAGGEYAEKHTGHNPEEGMDPHIWLAPKLVKKQAETILNALIQADPAHEADFQANFQKFMRDLDDLDAQLAQAFSPWRGRKLFVYHPAYGYLADAYGFFQIPLEIEGKEPAPRDLAQYIKLARQNRVQVIFVQPQFSQKSAQTLAQAIGGAVVPLDPIPEDYFASMRKIAETVNQALKDPRRQE